MNSRVFSCHQQGTGEVSAGFVTGAGPEGGGEYAGLEYPE